MSEAPHLSSLLSTFYALSTSVLEPQVLIKRKREITLIKHLKCIAAALGMLHSLSLLHTDLQAVGILNPCLPMRKLRLKEAKYLLEVVSA